VRPVVEAQISVKLPFDFAITPLKTKVSLSIIDVS
jgi:hypothetical protein